MVEELASSDQPSAEVYLEAARRQALVIRLVMPIQLVFSWGCLVGSIATFLLDGSYIQLAVLANVAATLPLASRLIIYEVQRSIVEYLREAAGSAPTPQVDRYYTVLKASRNRWIGGLAGEFIISMLAALAGIALDYAENPLSVGPALVLWILALTVLIFFTRDTIAILRTLTGDPMDVPDHS